MSICGCRIGARTPLVIFALCITALLLVVGAQPAHAQLSCGAMIDPIVLTPGPHFVGDTVRLRIGIGVGAIGNGTKITIEEVRHKLDCVTSDICEFCVDEGTIVTFQGGVTTDCRQPGDLFDTIWDTPPAADVNEVIFVASPQPQELAAFESCSIEFDVMIEAAGGPPTPMFIEAASCFDGVCDNNFPSAARGTVAIAIELAEVELDKQVSCDNGATWQDVGFGDNAVNGCTTFDGEPVLVRYLANNPSAADLNSCSLTDSNGEVLAAPEDIGDIVAGFTGEIFQTAALECGDLLAEGEPNTATLTCQDTGGATVEDSDTATFSCAACDVELDKQVSCDDGATWNDVGFGDGAVAGCDALNGGLRVRYLARSTSDVDLTSCVLTESNGEVLGNPVPINPLNPGFDGEIFQTGALTCSDALEAGEPNTATLSCECETGAVNIPVDDSDTATFECLGCDVQVDRQVSCDGGATFQDVGYGDGAIEGCNTLDGEPVIVRYLGRNDGEDVLENCTLTDSNGGVLGAALPVGPIDIGFDGVLFETDPLTCSDALDAAEPGTVTLSCECVDDATTVPVSDTDTAEFECEGCDVQVDKQVSCDGGATWQDTGFDDAGAVGSCDTFEGDPVRVRYLVNNPAEVALDSCVFTDSNGAILAAPEPVGTVDVGFNGVLFETGDLTCDDLLEAGEPNTVSVTCECRNDGGENVEVSDTDEAAIECLECDAQLDKQVSCDNGATWNDAGFDDGAIDGCSAVDGLPVLVRYLANNLSGVELESCVLTDSNGNLLGGPESIGTIGVAFNGTIFEADPATCSDALDAAEPDTATLACECVDADGPNRPIERTDQATFECLGCDVQVDRQVSCDGGATFQDLGYADGAVDGCSTIDGESVIVRYTANNLSELDLDNCVLTDSNGEVLGAPVDVGTLTQGFDGQIFQTDPLTCSDTLEALEAGTATLSCECTQDDGSSVPVDDTDTAQFECEGCDVQVDKQVSCDGGATWQDTGFDDAGAVGSCDTFEGDPVRVRYLVNNPAEVALDSCVFTDSNGAILAAPEPVGTVDVGFNGVLFETGDLTCDDLLEAGEPNTVSVTCECRNDGGENVEVSDTDEAAIECLECDAQLDKQVSCDNGATWNDVGFDDGAIAGCAAIDGEPVLVRYLANNLSGVELDSCVLTDSNGNVLGGPESIGTIGVAFNGTIFEADPATCSDALDAAEPDTATLACECVDADGPNRPIERTDQATFECLGCDVQVDRQVSCDGGATFQDVGYADGAVDGCSTIDGEPVIVRYTANNLADVDLSSCVLTDSNAGVLGVPVDVGSLTQGFDGQIFQTGPLTCEDGLEALEPGTATLSCECVQDTTTVPVQDEDTARFECEGCDVQVDKQVSCDGGATWQDTGFDDAGAVGSCDTFEGDPVRVRYLVNNPAEVALDSCVFTDSNGAILAAPEPVGTVDVGFNGVLFETGDLTCDDLLEAGEPNTVSVTCECRNDGGENVEVSDTDEAAIECLECDAQLDKQVSCDNGATWNDVGFDDGAIAGCAAIDGEPVLVRYLANNLSGVELDSCVLTDSNGNVLGGPESIGTIGVAFNGTIFEADPATCSDALDAAEPDTATLACECVDADGPNRPIERTDQATFECLGCDVQVDRQVSCDGGATFQDVGYADGAVDGCSTIDGEPVIVRYTANNLADVDLSSCVLTDSNAGVLGVPVDVGSLTQGFDGQIFQTGPLTCEDGLEALEPGTATLSCECVQDGGTVPVEDEDTAQFECLGCDATVVKEVSCDNGATWQDSCAALDGGTVKVRYRASNPGQVALESCTVTDSNGQVLAAPAGIATIDIGFDGVVFEIDDLTCSDILEAGEPDTVTLSCECVEGTVSQPIERTDDASIECQGCDAQLDKQVSCDGGTTWQDAGYGDGAISGCTASQDGMVQVRYLANNLADVPLENCVLTDSNGAVLAAPVGVGPLAVGFNGEIFQTIPLECSDELTAGEPDTATLTCECVDATTTIPVVRTDSATFDCAECTVDVDKQISCDGGWTWVDVGFNDGVIDGCEAQNDGQLIKARYLARNPSADLTLENCFLTDSNHVLQNDPPIGDLPPGFEGVVWETIPRMCNDELDELEPDTATVVCECAGEEVVGTDQAWFDCRDCDVDVDRQVSCDGGLTWQDMGWRDGTSQGCTAADGETVKIRYLARTRSIKTLENCTLTDSNTGALAGPVDVGTLDIAFEGVIHEVDATCGAALDSGGPDTVTLSCECEPTCQTTCAMCSNYCLPGCPPDTSADNTDESSLTCN